MVEEKFLMNRETTLLMGKILGEIYRIQKRVDTEMCGVDEATIYGLLTGMEPVVNEQLQMQGISSQKLSAVATALNRYNDPTKMREFQGFPTIDFELEQAGVDRADAYIIFKYLKADGRFLELINKMDPGDLNKWER
jgi:hypothetical protein